MAAGMIDPFSKLKFLLQISQIYKADSFRQQHKNAYKKMTVMGEPCVHEDNVGGADNPLPGHSHSSNLDDLILASEIRYNRILDEKCRNYNSCVFFIILVV